MKYSDAHGHFHTFPDGILPESCVRAISCGTHPGDWEAVLRSAAADPRVVPALGLHPWFIAETPPGWLENLQQLLEKPGSGVGEVGLDRSRRSPPLDEQEEVLRAQLAIAARRGIPVTLHCVGAWGRLLAVLDDTLAPEAPVLLHGFCASVEMLERFAARRGTYFSFGGSAGADLLKRVPIERLVFESDAAATNGRTPEEAREAVHAAASVLGLPATDLAESATRALERFLGPRPIS